MTIGLALILAGITALTVRSTRFDFSSARDRVVNQVRNARMDAVTRGAHYRVTFEETAIEIQRLADPDEDGVWEPDPNSEPKRIDFPAGVVVELQPGGVGGQPTGQTVEFDTRGMLARGPDGSMPDKVTVTLKNTSTGATRTLEIWPSGQIVVPRAQG